MKLTFVGGGGEVTGACYLLEDGGLKILVDCGLHQGSRHCEKENFIPFPFDVKTINALLVTHAHIDHIGRIPRLVRDGFGGPIYSTAPTKDAAQELLLDAHHLMLQEITNGETSLYEVEDINRAMEIWEVTHYRKPFGVKQAGIEFYNSGHILGSASIKITVGGKSIIFSGDLGNVPSPLVKDTEYTEKADYAVIESAYGGRIHEPVNERTSVLEDIIEDTVKAKGTLLIPAFAMERTQQLLFELNMLIEEGRIPRVPIFIDSPLAIRLTQIYQKYSRDKEFFDQEAIETAKKGDQIFNFPGLRFTLTTEESKEINNVPPPKVVIAGSGMSHGGRILHHEIRYLPDPNSTFLIVGFQTEGSLGRRILDGVGEIKIMGEKVPVRCRVKAIGAYSAHADQPLLLNWIRFMSASLKKVFVVQGEKEQSSLLAQKIVDEFAVEAEIPKTGEEQEL
ncbi:MAG: RNA-metabolising metallo-beta-lactamase, metallo-beta-lactamase family protein [Candidatus Wolfebacteria bacterium GW2011_GWC1_43_10]|uniref:RNA-metabolising metallo-beta-lactamase, metallo-beta-lactamase family protein n=2 Tax=Candidatus Wolfeibacteriota TaxID=1752735 RepID=A0A0G1CAT9_9BACT|nr:MAG: RNA-metabolising metallo-beta-lactamase, metallo-beta-lactamase family protein [Candidatus Wolfebacteria bacterium GW2011_GWC1_43_10]KKT23162.1 MAG: RNA-metabolising metallo-beta-lactamase [Parcubacteria group bacterium GW2011_GWB1_43_8b]